MSNDLQSSEDVPDERLKIESLKKRLSKVNEVVELVGPLPSTTSETIDEILSDLDAVLQKQTETDEKSRLKLSDLNKLNVSSEDFVDVPLDERLKKHESLTKKIKTLEEQLKDYKKVLGDKADSKYEKEFTDAQRRTGECQNIDDDQKAILEIEAIDKIASDAISSMIQEVKVETRKKTVAAIENPDETFKLPVYGGILRFKSSNEKNFERDVANPVATMLKKITNSIKSDQVISEEDQDELRRLQGVVHDQCVFYSKMLRGIDEKQHPHTHTLYEDYLKTCDKWLELLKNSDVLTVPPDLTAYRIKKREVDAAFVELDKRIGVWKRIDSETQGQHQDFAKSKRDEYQKVLEQFDNDGDAIAGAKSLDALLQALKKAKDAVFGSPESNQILDDEVKKLGKAPKKTEDVEFLKEALKARYNLERVDGDLNGVCLAAFYSTFAMVPDSHTKNNQWLTDLERDKNTGDIGSFYHAEDKDNAPKKEGLIAIKAMRAGGPLTMIQNGLVSEMLLKNVEGSKKVDQFSWVTLHEIGHAVDHSDDFMAKRRAEFGDWKEHSESDIFEMMLKAFRKEHPDAPKEFAEAYLKAVRAGKDPAAVVEVRTAWSTSFEQFAKFPGGDSKEKQDNLLKSVPLVNAEELRLMFVSDDRPHFDELSKPFYTSLGSWTPKPKSSEIDAMRLADDLLQQNETRSAAELVRDFFEPLGDPSSEKPDWESLKKSEILAWYKNAVLKEPKNILDGIILMTGGANWIRAGAVPRPDGRVYQEAYPGKWVSYDEKIWDSRVTDYQMRSPNEYFAEAYAAYFLGKLPKSAPLYKALEDLQQKKELAN